jgi:hypothetical protein
MSADSSSQPAGWDRAKEALADIRACPGEVQSFVASLFDHLGGLTDELLAHEIARHDLQRQAERDALQAQIDRLAAVAAQLAKTVALQEQLVGHANGDGRT